MSSREIKFRTWEPMLGMHEPWTLEEKTTFKADPGRKTIEIEWMKGTVFMQWTGLKDKNGVEIYEGDIFRIEENAIEVDDVDRIFYVVIVWVQEWCMFCSLLVEDEYFDYKNDGIKGLDEPMFWTYTLEDTNSRKHFLCGNIYEQPHLLTSDPSRHKKTLQSGKSLKG